MSGILSRDTERYLAQRGFREAQALLLKMGERRFLPTQAEIDAACALMDHVEAIKEFDRQLREAE